MLLTSEEILIKVFPVKKDDERNAALYPRTAFSFHVSEGRVSRDLFPWLSLIQLQMPPRP